MYLYWYGTATASSSIGKIPNKLYVIVFPINRTQLGIWWLGWDCNLILFALLHSNSALSINLLLE